MRIVVPDMRDEEALLRWDAQRRAARGASLLDSDKPDWYQDIDPDRLDINNPRRCVLKQVYGSFTEGRALLDIEGYSHGFSGDSGGVLREAWIDEAAVRLAKGGPRPVAWHKRLWSLLTA